MGKSKFLKLNKDNVEKEGGMVVLPVSEYKQLLQSAAPAYRLSGEEADKLDKLVKEGLREHEEGKTDTVSSLSEID